MSWYVHMATHNTASAKSDAAFGSLTSLCVRVSVQWTYQHEAEIAAVIALRESIRPYVEYHLLQASLTGVPILQPMWYNFTDAQCLEEAAETQFMFGPTFLVAPVITPNATSRSVYLPALPASEAWVHFYSGAVHKGGATINVAVTLADFPLFPETAHQSAARRPHTAPHVRAGVRGEVERKVCEHGA